MKGTSQILTVLVAVTMIGPAVAAIPMAQQASAQGIIVDYKEQFDTLSTQFQQDVLGLVAGDPPTEADPPTEVDPPDPDKLAALFDNYEQESFRLFGLEPPTEAEPPEPDRPTEGDPPIEADPPSETEPPEPDLNR